ncbi:MAG: helix-turn-helix domain-containing protein [Kangiellaceae bacterium]|nr:helix-turn-helix domain-containing protein [Kangiellaceae bacterium]
MSIFTQHLFAIGIFQGMLLAVLLALSLKVSVASRILGIWCLLLALSFLGVLVSVNQELSFLSFLVGWTYFLPASFGALFYLYCRYAITEQAFNPKDIFHFTPFLACYLLNIDILLAPLETKLNYLQTAPPTTVSFTISQVILFSQAFAYIGLSVLLIRRHERRANDQRADFNPLIFPWLWKIAWLNCLIWTLKVISTFIPFLLFLSRVADGLIVIFIYSIAMAQWRYPHLFNVGQLNNLNKQADPDTADGSTDKASTGKSSALDEQTRKLLLDEIKAFMEKEKPYLRSKLTLQHLAKSIDVSSHHLSETLNQQEGKNFYQFINQYRIEHICEQLKQDSSQKIIDLALASGFSSKSTFNVVFKQFTNKTPSQYRANLREHS